MIYKYVRLISQPIRQIQYSCQFCSNSQLKRKAWKFPFIEVLGQNQRYYYKIISYQMIKVLLLLKTFYSYLNTSFIPQTLIQTILQQSKQFNQILQHNYSQIIARLQTPIYTFIFLILTFSCLSSILFIVNLFFVGLTIVQPTFNHYLNQLIEEARNSQNNFQDVLWVCLWFFGFKIVSAVISVSHHLITQFLGCKMYILLVQLIVHYCGGNTRENGNLIAMIEQDCQRFINFPFSLITIIMKNLQFFFFVGYLISILTHYQFEILAVYIIYFLVSLLVSAKYGALNLKIMNNKQRRLSFADQTIPQLRSNRQEQIQRNIKLMGYNGATIFLPDLVNTIVMIFLYSIGDIDKQDKYTLLIIFGFLKSTVSGMGSAFNIISQISTNARRIITQIHQQIESLPTHKSDPHSKLDQQHRSQEQTENQQFTAISNRNKINYSKIIKKLIQYSPYFIPIFFLLLLLCFGTYFTYGYAAQSITSGGSVLNVSNFVILVAQFVMPLLFYGFVCHANVQLSRMIYDVILENPKKMKNITSEQLNRLSGDTRVVDRSLATYVFSNFTGLMHVLASLLFSIVKLSNIVLCLLFVFLLLAIVYGLKILFVKTMIIRRNIYRRQVLAKGLFLQNLRYTTNSQNNLYRIYCFKQFGFLIQSSFIFTLYITIVLLATILIFTLLLAAPSEQSMPILILLLIQLDSNFINVCLYWILYELGLTSTQRCIVMVQQFELNNPQDAPDSNISIIKQSLIQQEQ